ncbi:hypothetical protein TNCV_2734271 [Trichonephila clavipes]|nr:hypothetical protein TNCV_2734271 [Trichonephila clavipes]
MKRGQKYAGKHRVENIVCLTIYEQQRKRKVPVLPQDLKRGVSSSLYSISHKHMRKDINKHIVHRSLRYFQDHQMKDRGGGPIHLINRTVKKEERRLTEPKRPGVVLTEDTVQPRRKPTVRPCPYYLRRHLKRIRRTTGGAEEYGDRKPATEQPQEKEP